MPITYTALLRISTRIDSKKRIRNKTSYISCSAMSIDFAQWAIFLNFFEFDCRHGLQIRAIGTQQRQQ